jgi:hypothetical protein
VLDWRLSAKTRAIITSRREHLRRFALSASDCGASTHGDINSVPVEVFVMIESSDFRITKIPLNHGAGHMPVPEFGTVATMQPRR